MDGSEVTVVILGENGVGKTSFIEHCFMAVPRHSSQHAKVVICGQEINIRIMKSPGRQQLVPAIMVIMLFDLTRKESFSNLSQLLQVAQRVSPVSLRAVVGTKADLVENREVTTQEALDFCSAHSGSAVPMPYYETSTKFDDSILLAFQEIMARPLINDYVIKTTTEQEQKIFVHEVMEWAISNSSANILTHLRELGYPIPLNIIEKYPRIIRDYLLGEYPLREVPRFKHLELKELQEVLSWEDSSILEGGENTLTIQDTRPTIQVSRMYHLLWKDISLPLFPPPFLEQDAMDTQHLTHIDLSHNKLTSILPQFFQIPLLESLDVSHNLLTVLPSVELWSPDSRLQLLKVAHNRLKGEGHVPIRSARGRCGVSSPLWYVDLSHNQFHSFPYFVLHFSLHYLDISHNNMISQLPLELVWMDKIKVLLLNGLVLVDPPFFVVEEGPQAILHYLRLKMECKVPLSNLRVVVVGPHLSGKTSLISKITGIPSTENKALDVVEWKYKGNEIFSFRSRWVTFDFWDFSGDPELQYLYPCFQSQNSLHLVVCNARSGVHDLARQLADLQSLSAERIVILVVFTHMDHLRPREEKEKFKKTCLEWLSYHNKQGGNGSFSLMATSSVRSLHGEEMLTSYEACDVGGDSYEVLEVKGPDIPLMPILLRIHFVSSITGEGIPNLRKVLYRVSTGYFSSQLTSLSRTTLISREVPYKYMQIENMLRQLQFSHRATIQGREQRAFYTRDELGEELKKPLHDLKVTGYDFNAALSFLHQFGFVYLHHFSWSESLVCIDPQVIGYLLHRTMQACRMNQETNSASIFLANTHLSMIWGVEPVVSTLEKQPRDILPSVTSSHLLHFLSQLKLFSPLLPGTMLVVPILPHTLPRSCDPDSTYLTPRRSYVLSFLPSYLHSHLISQIVSAVVRETEPSHTPSSPNVPSPPPTIPIVLASGLELYIWQRNIFVSIPKEQIKVWIRVRDGDIGLEPLPYCGRIDVHISSKHLNITAHWLRIVTEEIDKVLEVMYPHLLDASRPQKVEIFVPLNHNSVVTTSVAGTEGGCGSDLEDSSDITGGVTHNNASKFPSTLPKISTHNGSNPILKIIGDGSSYGSPLGATPPLSGGDATTLPHKFSGDELPGSPLGGAPTSSTQGAKFSGDKLPGSPLGGAPTSSTQGANLIRKHSGEGSPSSPLSTTSPSSGRPAKLSEHSWEILSKYSTTSNRLSILQDTSDPHYDLVPLWECLQEAFKTPVIRVESSRLVLSHVIPDLLFADLPPELLFRSKVSSPDRYLVSLEDRLFGGVAPPPPEATGMFIQSYYSFDHDDVFVRKPPGAIKAFYLQSCLTTLRKDLLKLKELSSPHLVAPVGLQYCPPCLALEASPFGSLRSWMKRLKRKLGRVETHHISLQLLSALKFFHQRNTNYHSINSDNVLVWNLDPLVVKLSHSGIIHASQDCELCIYLDSKPKNHPTYRFDYMLLGLLVYEMATGKRPFEEVYPLNAVVLGLVLGDLELNIEADHFLQKQGKTGGDSEQCIATGCQRLCLQSSIDHCLLKNISHRELEAQFSLCAGDSLWSPMRLLVNVEVIVSSNEPDLLYWASGSRGLVTGTIEPSTGILGSNILQEAPPPESGMFANRRSKPVPIAVGRASGLALVQTSNQLWVGSENGQMGSVYVFNLPDMRRHHHIHLQDAVLSLSAVNKLADKFGGDEMKYRVLVGLANGTIILFLGIHEGKVLENPLQGPKLVITTHQRRPCLTMTLTSDGHIWCSCGNSMELYDICSLKLVRRLSTCEGARGMGLGSRGDVITLMIVSSRGVWTVGRRSTILRLWNKRTGQFKASYDVSNIIQNSDADITSLAVHGGALWLGTRNGYLFILDGYLMEDGKDPLLGLQQCGQGKIKCIVPFTPSLASTSRLQVMCSLEFPDEVSCLLLSWEYFTGHGGGGKGSSSLDEDTSRISTTMPNLHVSSSYSNPEPQHQCKSF